jgi:hypothetical protein
MGRKTANPAGQLSGRGSKGLAQRRRPDALVLLGHSLGHLLDKRRLVRLADVGPLANPRLDEAGREADRAELAVRGGNVDQGRDRRPAEGRGSGQEVVQVRQAERRSDA